MVGFLNEKIPDDVELAPVELFTKAGEMIEGVAAIRQWNKNERIKRGFKLSGRILVPVVLFILPFGFLDPFAFMVWGSAVMAFIVAIAGPFLFSKYWAEQISFFYVDAECPNCRVRGRLRPFLSAGFATEFTILCPACGETALARANLPTTSSG